jgi:hypothetical protein
MKTTFSNKSLGTIKNPPVISHIENRQANTLAGHVSDLNDDVPNAKWVTWCFNTNEKAPYHVTDFKTVSRKSHCDALNANRDKDEIAEGVSWTFMPLDMNKGAGKDSNDIFGCFKTEYTSSRFDDKSVYTKFKIVGKSTSCGTGWTRLTGGLDIFVRHVPQKKMTFNRLVF